MSENNDFLLTLANQDTVDQCPVFTRDLTVKVATPSGIDREVKFKATLKLLSLDDFDDLKAKETVAGVVEHCLVKIDGIPSNETYTAEQVAIKVTDICSRLFGELEVRHGEQSRNTILASYERGNSKRSRKR